jgi:hypothetical protein
LLGETVPPAVRAPNQYAQRSRRIRAETNEYIETNETGRKVPTSVTISNSDYDEIVAAVQAYIDGSNEGDAEKFKKAFHEDAWMFYVDADGKLIRMHLDEDVFRNWARDGKGGNIELRIVSVAQMGDVASVALRYGDDWLDFHSLVRLNGEWKSVCKTASHSSR